jgi:hypothetical protein
MIAKTKATNIIFVAFVFKRNPLFFLTRNQKRCFPICNYYFTVWSVAVKGGYTEYSHNPPSVSKSPILIGSYDMARTLVYVFASVVVIIALF